MNENMPITRAVYGPRQGGRGNGKAPRQHGSPVFESIDLGTFKRLQTRYPRLRKLHRA